MKTSVRQWHEYVMDCNLKHLFDVGKRTGVGQSASARRDRRQRLSMTTRRQPKDRFEKSHAAGGRFSAFLLQLPFLFIVKEEEKQKTTRRQHDLECLYGSLLTTNRDDFLWEYRVCRWASRRRLRTTYRCGEVLRSHAIRPVNGDLWSCGYGFPAR